MEKKNTRRFVMLHLSVLLGCIIPLGNIWGPMLVSYGKTDPQLKKSAVNIINFHILWSIVLILLVFVFWYRQIIKFSQAEGLQMNILLPAAVCFVIINLLYPILVSAIVGVTGKVKLYYPTLIKFMKTEVS